MKCPLCNKKCDIYYNANYYCINHFYYNKIDNIEIFHLINANLKIGKDSVGYFIEFNNDEYIKISEFDLKDIFKMSEKYKNLYLFS